MATNPCWDTQEKCVSTWAAMVGSDSDHRDTQSQLELDSEGNGGEVE